MKTILIIPTYNEAQNLPNIVEILLQLPIVGLSVLVVDDNSPDGTGQIAEDLKGNWGNRLQVLHRAGKLGLGTAYIQGFRYALEKEADIIGQMDADFSHSPQKIVELLNTLQNCDVAIGSRYIPGGSVDKRWAFWRKGLSAFGNFYARTILNLPIRDVTGGFRFWRSEGLARLPLRRVRSNGYVFQVEMAYLAHKFGLRFNEVPIHFFERKWGKSKMSFGIQLEAAVKVWLLLWQYRDL